MLKSHIKNWDNLKISSKQRIIADNNLGRPKFDNVDRESDHIKQYWKVKKKKKLSIPTWNS